MYSQGKKALNILILNILKEHSDSEHHLTQQDIIRLLKSTYYIECDRRSVKNNVLSLIDLGYDIDLEDGYFLAAREFEDAELRLLIDSVLFSTSISQSQSRELIRKLCSLSSVYFRSKLPHIRSLGSLRHSDNKQVFYTLDTLNDAISEKRKISFLYNDYGTDFRLHPKREKPFIVNPYHLVANNGRYYLICNYDKYDDISHFRIDKMTEVTMLPDSAKPLESLPGLRDGLNLPKHMAEHVYMFSGPAVNIRLRTARSMMSELVDWFGHDFHVVPLENDMLEVRLSCNAMAMKYWALQYGLRVEILEPESLRNEVRDAAKTILRKYEPKPPVLTTLCYIEKDGQYLMLHRTKKENDMNGGKWIGIGGKFETGESPEDCLRREALEETGLTLRSCRFRGIVTFLYGDVTEYMHLYTSSEYDGTLTDCDEGELQWVPVDKVLDLNLWEGDRIFLRLLLERDSFFSLKLVYDKEQRLVSAALDGKAVPLPLSEA